MENRIFIGLLVAIALVLAFNTYQLNTINTTPSAGIATGITNAAATSEVIPTGIPKIYGSELGLSYDDVSAYNPQLADLTIRKLAVQDQNIELKEEQLQRYINILYNMEQGISCEYCCGARAIIFENGQPACGCAHSYAMRGLTKYLITKHGEEYTDTEILEEVGKWKTLFFPTQITAKAKILESQGIETNHINLASNKYRGIEKGSTSEGMVGGC